MKSIELPHVRYFGFFRYIMESEFILYKDMEKVAIEPRIFSYQFIPPYIYIYGVSGYTKVNVSLWGSIEKIPNMSYYQYVEPEFTSPFVSTLERLKDKLGFPLILKDSLKNVSLEDYKIYQTLRMKGAISKEAYFMSQKNFFNKPNEMVGDIENGLDSL